MARNVVEWAMHQVYVQTLPCVHNLVMVQVGNRGEAPTKLRVRATTDFAKGELVLVPHLGRNMTTMLYASANKLNAKYEQPDKTEMDIMSIPRAMVRAIPQEQKGKGKGKQGTNNQTFFAHSFFAISPLFMTKKTLKDKKEPVTFDLSPFWAIPREPTSKNINMEIQTWVIAVHPPKPIGGARLPVQLRKQMYNVVMQVAVNTVRINAGTYLGVSQMRNDFDANLGVSPGVAGEDGGADSAN